MSKEMHDKISKLEVENKSLRKKMEFFENKVHDLSTSFDQKVEENN